MLKKNIQSKFCCLQSHNKKFVGIWNIQEENINNIVNIEECGKVSKVYNNDYKSIGYWENNNNNFFLNIRENYLDKNYYGKIYNSTFFSGEVCEGNSSPYYFGKFYMKPIFYQFHNKTSENKIDNYIYVDYQNITGKWMIENTDTKNIYMIEMYKNNTWESSEGLKGKWNLYNRTHDINLNTAISNKGKNIWLLIKRDMNNIYMDSDILLLGKIVQFGKNYLTSEKSPNNSEYEIIQIVSKIKGYVIYGFESDPEISESFYMKRWWK